MRKKGFVVLLLMLAVLLGLFLATPALAEQDLILTYKGETLNGGYLDKAPGDKLVVETDSAAGMSVD